MRALHSAVRDPWIDRQGSGSAAWRELPQIIGQFTILLKESWEGTNEEGNKVW
jgi:hypothetical protein